MQIITQRFPPPIILCIALFVDNYHKHSRCLHNNSPQLLLTPLDETSCSRLKTYFRLGISKHKNVSCHDLQSSFIAGAMITRLVNGYNYLDRYASFLLRVHHLFLVLCV